MSRWYSLTEEQQKSEASRTAAWAKANPEKRARSQLRYRVKQYGITVEDYYGILESQDNSCAICKTNNPGEKTTWRIDHCHSTNEVRGILCHPCNVMLGLAKDNTQTLESAVKYLGKHHS